LTRGLFLFVFTSTQLLVTFSLDGTLSFEGVALDSVAVVDFTVVVVGAESWDLLSGGTADEF